MMEGGDGRSSPTSRQLRYWSPSVPCSIKGAEGSGWSAVVGSRWLSTTGGGDATFIATIALLVHQSSVRDSVSIGRQQRCTHARIRRRLPAT